MYSDRSLLSLLLMTLSPLISVPWLDERSSLVLLLLVSSSIAVGIVRREASIMLSVIALGYVLAAAYKGLGGALSVVVFVIGLFMSGWIPKSGVLEAILWWIGLSLPPALVLVFSRVSLGSFSYLMLLMIIVASSTTFYIYPPSFKMVFKRGGRVAGSKVNLMSAGLSIFELIYYALLIYASFHLNKAVAGIISVTIALILRRFISRKWLPLIASITFAIIYYI